jgi:Pectate lyase superfamily protein
MSGRQRYATRYMTNPRWVDLVPDLLTINNTATEAVIVRNHSAENDGGGGVFCWMTGTATSNNGTIVVPTTPNGGFWKRSFDGPVNVRWFGARGDGATNDTAAIQAAINAVGLVGGAVLIPPGTFCVDNLTISASRVTITGLGKTSILAKNGDFNALITVGPSVDVDNVVIRDLMITTKQGVTPAGWGIFCNSSASWLTLDSIYMLGMAFGIGLQPVYNPQDHKSQVHNALIRNCALNVITHQGIALFNCVDTFISDSGIFMNGYTAGSVGLQYDSGCDGLYTSNLIVTQGQTPIAIQNSNPGIANNQPPRHGFFSRTVGKRFIGRCT